VPAATLAAVPAIGEELRGQHEQPGVRIEVAGLPGRESCGVSAQDRLALRMIDGEPVGVRLGQLTVGKLIAAHIVDDRAQRLPSPSRRDDGGAVVVVDRDAALTATHDTAAILAGVAQHAFISGPVRADHGTEPRTSRAIPTTVGTMPRQTNAGRKHSPSGAMARTPARLALATAAACSEALVSTAN